MRVWLVNGREILVMMQRFRSLCDGLRGWRLGVEEAPLRAGQQHTDPGTRGVPGGILDRDKGLAALPFYAEGPEFSP